MGKHGGQGRGIGTSARLVCLQQGLQFTENFMDSAAQPAGVPGDLEATSVPRRILIVEDDALASRHLRQLMPADGLFQVEAVQDGAQALAKLEEQPFSLVITDLRMPHLDGMELIQAIQDRHLPVTVIVTTGEGSVEEAVQAMRLGVYHFLTKPIDTEQLRLVVKRALQDRALQDEVVYLREQCQARHAFRNMLSKSPKMLAVFELISNLSHTNTTVLIQGETGTGKEEVARAIHQSTTGRTGPLVAVNCAALPETLLESELLGHEKGAFTGAVGQRRGRFELANGGTIFLDEVGDVPPAMQAKLLRVLQERRFERVGGTKSIEVDVRVIAASNRSLLRLVKKGTFREDLYYRLNVVQIDLPPLRERKEDIPLLATHFIQKYTQADQPPRRLTPEAMEALLDRDWPGNIRQLENAIERACVTARDGSIRLENLPPDVAAVASSRSAPAIDLERPLTDLLSEATAALEKEYINKALRKAHGNVGRCARICGLSRRSVSAKISQYHIDKSAFKEAPVG
jgi:DNA-binding NtrC family response regulator